MTVLPEQYTVTDEPPPKEMKDYNDYLCAWEPVKISDRKVRKKEKKEERKNMSGMRRQYDEEYKKNAVKLSHASPKSVKDTAEEGAC